ARTPRGSARDTETPTRSPPAASGRAPASAPQGPSSPRRRTERGRWPPDWRAQAARRQGQTDGAWSGADRSARREQPPPPLLLPLWIRILHVSGRPSRVLHSEP